jgi:RNA polymerase sigma-70 factor (ECF subfamily)
VPHQADSLSFADVYGEFQPKIRRYLSRLVGTSEAEDLTQEVFAKVSQALSGFTGASSLSTWIYRTATNTAYDRLRQLAAKPARPTLLHIARAPAEAPSGIEQELARREMSDCVRRYVDELPAAYRSVLLLSEDEGLTDRQIAEALGITVSSVKIRLHRARARIKAALEGGCTFYRDERSELVCEPRPKAVSSDG